jgi:trans-aconitate methyltransferase
MKQTWNADAYRQNAGFVPELGYSLIDWLAPRPPERVLDLGCGDGVLTQRIAQTGCLMVGVDNSPDLVAAARSRGLDARLLDGEHLHFDNEFDAVFSNAALHWMTRPAAVIEGVRRALRPGGRFVGELGAAGNVEHIHAALRTALLRRGLDPAPCEITYFPSPESYRAKLEDGGFEVARIASFERPTPLPTGMAGWLTTFALSYLRAVPHGDRASLVGEVVQALRPVLCDAGGNWHADYVRLRFAAISP